MKRQNIPQKMLTSFKISLKKKTFIFIQGNNKILFSTNHFEEFFYFIYFILSHELNESCYLLFPLSIRLHPSILGPFVSRQF